MTKGKKQSVDALEFQQKIDELTNDLQRTRADFENYRKRVDVEKNMSREAGQVSTILKLLPVIDNIERAIAYLPDELKDNNWAQSVVGLVKNLEKSVDGLGLVRIDAKAGTVFNPELHEAVQFDEDANDSPDSEEIISEELQPGYLLNGQPIRHAMVKVTRK
jgi:molecular chaperone GrpE